MIELGITITLLLALSFLCSVLESIILSLSRPYIQGLIEKGRRSGRTLKGLKDNIEQPITAILTLNTISHTVGAAVSGALALDLFGSKWMALFSAILTLLILVFSEIIPKTVGARHWRSLAPPAAALLTVMIWVLKPVIVPVHWMSHLFSSDATKERVNREEILHFIRMGQLEGAVRSQEFRISENLFKLRDIPVAAILTPAEVSFRLSPHETVGSVIKKGVRLQFSRFPLIDPEDGAVGGVVLRRDIMDRAARDEFDDTLASLARPAETVSPDISVYDLLNTMLRRKIHLGVVIGDGGAFQGVVTLEDALESLLGMEIVDESDPVADMRELASREAAPAARPREDGP